MWCHLTSVHKNEGEFRSTLAELTKFAPDENAKMLAHLPWFLSSFGFLSRFCSDPPSKQTMVQSRIDSI